MGESGLVIPIERTFTFSHFVDELLRERCLCDFGSSMSSPTECMIVWNLDFFAVIVFIPAFLVYNPHERQKRSQKRGKATVIADFLRCQQDYSISLPPSSSTISVPIFT